jgi:hypothetical protein
MLISEHELERLHRRYRYPRFSTAQYERRYTNSRYPRHAGPRPAGNEAVMEAGGEMAMIQLASCSMLDPDINDQRPRPTVHRGCKRRTGTRFTMANPPFSWASFVA